MLFRLANDIPRVNDSRNPSQDAKQEVDEEICAAAAPYGDGQKWKPYCEEVEEDCALIYRQR